jgi:hypothetical protein
MKTWIRAAIWGLFLLTGVNVVGTAYHFVLQRQLRTARAPEKPPIGAKFPKFSGVDVRDVKWEARDAPCRVIRVTDDQCVYCSKDKASYDAIVDAAQAVSCEVIELSPRAGGIAGDDRPGVVQLKFVNADLGLFLAPFVTPETIILDRSWSLQLAQRGMFDDETLASSLALIGRLAAPQQ